MIKTHAELIKLHGKKITCVFEDKFIDDAMISVEDNKEVFICQNENDGLDAKEMFGYKYSWFISSEDSLYEDDYFPLCKDIKLKEIDLKTPRLITEDVQVMYRSRSGNEWEGPGYLASIASNGVFFIWDSDRTAKYHGFDLDYTSTYEEIKLYDPEEELVSIEVPRGKLKAIEALLGEEQ